MNKIVKWFLLAQLLDLLTTLVGIIYFEAIEGNPIMNIVGLPMLIAIKLISMLMVSIVLMVRLNKRVWFGIFLIVLSSIAPIWNTGVILLTIITGNGII